MYINKNTRLYFILFFCLWCLNLTHRTFKDSQASKVPWTTAFLPAPVLKLAAVQAALCGMLLLHVRKHTSGLVHQHASKLSAVRAALTHRAAPSQVSAELLPPQLELPAHSPITHLLPRCLLSDCVLLLRHNRLLSLSVCVFGRQLLSLQSWISAAPLQNKQAINIDCQLRVLSSGCDGRLMLHAVWHLEHPRPENTTVSFCEGVKVTLSFVFFCLSLCPYSGKGLPLQMFSNSTNSLSSFMTSCWFKRSFGFNYYVLNATMYSAEDTFIPIRSTWMCL